jgi:diguanylate cyclase (GGDEF)-like protein
MNNIAYPLSMLIGLGIALVIFFTLLFFLVYKKFNKSLDRLEGTLEKVMRFSNHDPLTGLPNRSLFFEQFKTKLINAEQHQQKVALLFIDIDNFRGIKDAHGYTIGDLLLQAIAKRMLVAMNNNKESLARLASDQFTVILENIKDQKSLYETINKILGIFSVPFSLQGIDIASTASIGVSLYPDDGEDVENLLKSSGVARYQAKQMGSNTYSFYTKEMDTTLAKQRTIETHLRKAITKGELVVCYQPKVNILDKKITGAEALLQWNNPELGRVSPAQFIPLAEQTGLIVSIGNWVLNESCKQTKTWHNQGFTDFSVAVNLSAYQFKTGDIAEQVAKALWDSELNPEMLELELTESLVMENLEKSLLMLRVLKTMGIKISIDDFGTGYSSLSQLRKFPVDSLKIDQSFVKNIHHENKQSDDCAVITTIITMAKQLGLKVIAEGVETQAQFDFLKQQGCDLIQGYLFSRPIIAEEFTKLLTQNRQGAR